MTETGSQEANERKKGRPDPVWKGVVWKNE
jgi:hypothetical protein